MARRGFRAGIGFAAWALSGASAGLAQAPATPAEAPSTPIVVTGTRGEGAIVVDYRRIARACDACRRALGTLTGQAQPTRRLRDRIGRDQRTDRQSIAIVDWDPARSLQEWVVDCPAVCLEPPRQRMTRAATGAQRVDRQELARRQAGVALSAGGYLAELDRHLAPIVERHRVAHRARQVYRPGDISARYGRFPNVTAAVLDELNLALEGVDLLRPVATQ